MTRVLGCRSSGSARPSCREGILGQSGGSHPKMKSIPLTQGFVAKVDDDDYEALTKWKWYASVGRGGIPYAGRKDGRKGAQINHYMHRQILGLAAGDRRQADHIDGNTLNNCRLNLRFATSAQNAANQRKRLPRGRAASRYKGVFLDRRHRKWQSALMVGGKRHRLGYFEDEESAARAYDAAAIALQGEFAHLNFPLPSPASR